MNWDFGSFGIGVLAAIVAYSIGCMVGNYSEWQRWK